jgi:zinc transport system substrate-binding protein
MKKRIVFLLLIMLIFTTGCDLFKSDVMEDIDAYTTTYPINYLLNSLYGEHATIHSIYPTGVNFKDYELSEKKLNEYAKSDLFVFNSRDIEREYAIDMVNENQSLKLIDTSYGMDYDYGIEELWLNPYDYLMMAKNIRDSLAEYITNPYLVEGIDENYDTLKYNLSKLDAAYQETLKAAPYQVIVTDNSLFKYLEKYNIEVIALEEKIVTVIATEKDTLSDLSKTYNISVSDILTYNKKTEETLNIGEEIKIPIKTIDSSDLSKVKKLISEKKINYIYTDSEETNSTVKALLDEDKLELVTLNTMYSIDGGIGNNNESYLTVMNDNLEALKKELYK